MDLADCVPISSKEEAVMRHRNTKLLGLVRKMRARRVAFQASRACSFKLGKLPRMLGGWYFDSHPIAEIESCLPQ